MKTDIYIEILCQPDQERLAQVTLDQAFALFREFEERYSRFRSGNELWALNASKVATVSEELYALIEQARYWHAETKGVFDPSVLPALEAEGYLGAYTSVAAAPVKFSQVMLEPATQMVKKPLALKIDLGGIGKGFIVDKVGAFIRTRFEHFLIDAGGDILAAGENRALGYAYWAVGVEQPDARTHSLATVLLRNASVATSGKNRRAWIKEGKKKHHIIDPKSGRSAETDVESVTVLAPTTTAADVWAKTLFILGKARGLALATTKKIGVLFVSPNGDMVHSPAWETYVWKAAA